MIMNNAATLEASDSHVIRSILRSMVNEHWSVAEALDEYDIPGDLRDSYEAQIAEYFVTLRYGCDRCAEVLCKLKLARIGAQRVAKQLFVPGHINTLPAFTSAAPFRHHRPSRPLHPQATAP